MYVLPVTSGGCWNRRGYRCCALRGQVQVSWRCGEGVYEVTLGIVEIVVIIIVGIIITAVMTIVRVAIVMY